MPGAIVGSVERAEIRPGFGYSVRSRGRSLRVTVRGVTRERREAMATHTARRESESLAGLATLIFLQMLPATLLTPAIRPLFALHHGGNEGTMHAFLALNMLGGFVAAPILGAIAGRRARPFALLRALLVADAVLLASLAAPLSTSVILALRIAEGAAHIGAATILLAEAAALGRRRDDGRPMALAGAGIMFAVALGSAIGGLALKAGPQAPFLLGSALLLGVAVASLAWSHDRSVAAPRSDQLSLIRRRPALVVPLTAAFVERFTVGCLVVTFSLFAHNVHGMSDTTVGLLFSLLTLPFALSMYPIGRLGERVPWAAILGVGAAIYAVTLGVLGILAAETLPFAMIVLGLASGMMFSPTLSFAAALSSPDRADRGQAMGLVNAAGCLGMLTGPAVAGIVSSLARSETDPATGYRAVFVVAGASVIVWLVASARWLVGRISAGTRTETTRPRVA
jgi:MFS transporter, AAHS family, 3-hydroxyphenylpropionic acid transporter